MVLNSSPTVTHR